MEPETLLENKVSNAFIRRKQGYLVKVMQGNNYRCAAQKAMFDIMQLERRYRTVGSNPDIQGLAGLLTNELDDSFLGDVEKYAKQYAHNDYISPDKYKEESKNLADSVVADDEGIEKLKQAAKRSYDAVCENYQAVARALALSMIKSPDFALSREMMDTAIRNSFSSKKEFIAKENELANALSAYQQARLALNDVEGEQDGFYMSAMAIIANNVGVTACKMAAELEAGELYKA